MTFLSDGYLWHLCWMIPLLFIILHIGIAKREKIAIALFHSKQRADQYTDLSRTKRYLRFAALVLAVIFAIIAAARISWGREILPDSGTGRDLLIIFDVSKSMLSDDVKPTRMEQAKWLVQQIVKNNPADRFGLIAFAGDAFLQCPLTIDKTSFLQLTDALDTDTIPLGGTNVQLALETAVKAFESAEGNHKAVILLTDGDELTGKAEKVTKQLAEAHIPLFVAGIGDPANPSVIHVTDSNGQKKILTDKQGNAVKSPLNEKALATLARETSGIYVRSTATDPGLKEIQYAINGLNRKKGGSQLASTRAIERPVLPLCLALFFLLFFLTVNDVKGKKTIKGKGVVILLLLLSAFQLQAQDQTLAIANEVKKAPEKKEAAEQTFNWAEEYFNQGVKLQHDNELAKAKEHYEKAITYGKNEKIRAYAYQNLGIMPHQDARQKMTAANERLKNQNPDAAEKELNAAIASLDLAESLYKKSLRNSIIANVKGAFDHQQILLRDRKIAEELKKQIEELKKRQQQAQKQTQQAKDQQQKQNQQQNQQQQNQQQQNQQQQKQQTEQQTQQAQQAVDQLRDQAEKLKQDQLKKNAEKAAEELKKARQEQQKDNGKKAEEHLQKALQALGADQKQQNQPKDGKDQQKQDQQKDGKDQQKQDQQKDGKDQQNQNQNPQPQQTQQAQPQQGEERDIDKNQAEAILNVMEKEEKDLRDMLKQLQKRNAPAQKTDKDW